jgi:hypothetical protein
MPFGPTVATAKRKPRRPKWNSFSSALVSSAHSRFSAWAGWQFIFGKKDKNDYKN